MDRLQTPSWDRSSWLNQSVSWAKGELRSILEDLPTAKGNIYLVFSSPFGQLPLVDNYEEIYRGFADFFDFGEDGPAVARMASEIDSHNSRKDKEAAAQISEVLGKRLLRSKVSQDVNFEFRFAHLDYALIERLKIHPRVRQPEVMMRPAWIRVVLLPRIADSISAR